MPRTKTIFVIMPFRETPTRNKDDLTAFFQSNIKNGIESNKDLKYNYVVGRSDDTFNINETIIHQLYSADIVICDLSGKNSNPNVMYELGLRLAVSNEPVILIRESHPDNKVIFDISGFFIFDYNPFQYDKLEQYLIEKLKKYELGKEQYISPVLKVLETSPIIIRTISLRQAGAVLNGLSGGFHSLSIATASAIMMFIKNSTDMIITGDMDTHTMSANGVLEFIKEHDDKLKDIKWNSFLFQPSTPPSFIAYNQNPLLHGILPEPLPTALNTLLYQFYGRYLATNYLWTMPEKWIPIQFIKDALIMEIIIDNVIAAFSTEKSDEQQKYLNNLRELVLSTTLISMEHKKQLYPDEFAIKMKMNSKKN
jgi:hypothetical protein